MIQIDFAIRLLDERGGGRGVFTLFAIVNSKRGEKWMYYPIFVIAIFDIHL